MKYLPLLLPLFFLFACTDSGSDAQITGEWQGVSWIVNGETSDRDASQVTFSFEPTGTYSGAFGTQEEAGTYRVEGNKLYTHAEEQAEKMVEVALSGTDTLRMKMNRAGTPEELVLIKE
jgi:hypothetical protein